MEHILIVDDEPGIRFGLGHFLEAAGYAVSAASTVRQAREECDRIRPTAAIVDYSLPDGNGVDVIDSLLRVVPSATVIMLTAHGTIDLAVTAVKRGAATLVTKPIELPQLLALLKKSIKEERPSPPPPPTPSRAFAPKRLSSSSSSPSNHELDPFLGTSTAIAQLKEEARRISASRSPVLILGETGTGKGVLARHLHEVSETRSPSSAFVDLNCAGLSSTLIDNEMFGHAKGSFTGAVADRPGLLERTNNGTLFLDEIGDMPLDVQGKLLKVLEERRFRRIGELHDRSIDVRLIAATHCPLGKFVKEQRFRADLYYRVATFPLVVPPLRQRAEDIPAIAHALLDRAAGTGRDITFTRAALDALSSHKWPGNIRELRNVVDRALVAVDPDARTIDVEHLKLDAFPNESSASIPPQPASKEPPPSSAIPESATSQSLKALERTRIESVLREVGGRVEEAGRILGMPRSSLYFKIRKYGIVVPKS